MAPRKTGSVVTVAHSLRDDISSSGEGAPTPPRRGKEPVKHAVKPPVGSAADDDERGRHELALRSGQSLQRRQRVNRKLEIETSFLGDLDKGHAYT